MSESLIPFEPPREQLIQFDGDRLIAVELPGDGVAAPIRVLCEALDLDPATQADNIRAHPVLSRGLRMVNVTISGRVRSVAALIHTMTPYWLATVPPNQVKPERRAKLIRYQEEVANVLAQLFTGADAISVELSIDPTVNALNTRLNELLREVRLARDALLAQQRQIAAQLDAQQQQLTSLSDIVDELQTIIPVLPEQAAYLQQAMKQLAQRVATQRRRTGQGGQNEDNLYQLLFGQFKAHFRLPRYDALPARRYDETVQWLEQRAAELLPGDAKALPPRQEPLL